MAWKIELTKKAEKSLHKLGKQQEKIVIDYLENKIAILPHPSDRGEPLKGNRQGQWRYRIEGIRIICEIHDNTITILVVEVGHRAKIYN